jgi:cytochrome c oxidase assembly protein subunit 15
MNKRERTRPVAIWLFIMAALIALMVCVGGATRLTDSGLSIVEWRPVTGAIPPLSDAEWAREFEKYRAIPEYERVNFGMSLAEFKEIYWWEWGHRFLGRLLGLAFIAPLIVFVIARRVDRKMAMRLGGIFILGGLQGALGWWMVASGLSERVDVSQYRLAAHLSLAVLLFAAVLWTALDLTRGGARFVRTPLIFSGFVAAVFVQMVLGAFVAGLRAGRTFNTWPLMDGRFFPKGYFAGAPSFNDLFETAAAAQFNHRLGAYLLCALGVAVFHVARRRGLGRPGAIVLGALFAQLMLGIATVLAATPISLGLAHQALALGVFAAALNLAHGASMAIEAGSTRASDSGALTRSGARGSIGG